MTDITVSELAEIVHTSVDRLLAQMEEAGLPQRYSHEFVSDHDKHVFLAFLKSAHSQGVSKAETAALESGLPQVRPARGPIIIKNITVLPSEAESQAEERKPPKVFISYSYDSSKHEQWVEQLAKMLRSDGIDAVLDKWDLHPGDPITEFMESSVKNSDFVLIICTEKYKEKSDARKGGVGYEEAVITADLLANTNHRKYIPIMRSTDYAKSIPLALHSKKYIDLTNDDDFAPSYRDLLLTLYGKRPEAPPLGKTPDFI